jgi:hypothetical protein
MLRSAADAVAPVDLLVESGGFSVRTWEGYIRAGAG